jgi:hypothetical protein
MWLSGGTERIVRAAIRSWAATFRLCLIVVVVAVTAALFLSLVSPAALLSFME